MTHYKQLGIPEELHDEIIRVKDEIFHFKNETAVINILIALGIKFLEEDKKEITIDNTSYPYHPSWYSGSQDTSWLTGINWKDNYTINYTTDEIQGSLDIKGYYLNKSKTDSENE